jgi:hypothetical protein
MDDSECCNGKESDSSGTDMVQGIINFAVPAIAHPIEAPSAAHGTAPTGPANDPITPPTNEPTVEPMLLLSDAVALSPDAMSVNSQQPSYKRYKIVKVMKTNVMFL